MLISPSPQYGTYRAKPVFQFYSQSYMCFLFDTIHVGLTRFIHVPCCRFVHVCVFEVVEKKPSFIQYCLSLLSIITAVLSSALSSSGPNP